MIVRKRVPKQGNGYSNFGDKHSTFAMQRDFSNKYSNLWDVYSTLEKSPQTLATKAFRYIAQKYRKSLAFSEKSSRIHEFCKV